MDLLKAFGASVRMLRRQRGFSQEKLAELSKLHRTYISSVELGQRNVSLKNIYALAKALGVSMTDLIGSPEMENRAPLEQERAKKR
jgi:transcriptional regulator with XRE-family HTH domain